MSAPNDELRPLADNDEDARSNPRRSNLYVGAEEADHSIKSGGWTCKSICLCSLLLVVIFLLGALVGENAASIIPPQPKEEQGSESAATTSPPSLSTPKPASSPGSSPTPSSPPPTPKATPAPAPAGLKVSKSQLAAMRKATEDLMDMLEEYYGKHQSMLYDGYMASKQSSDAKMRKMAQESSAAMARKIAEALVDPTQKSFVIGVIGSSVAAGHDNCFYDCYEKQMERTWSSVWEAAGMKLEVRNAGQGGGCGDTYKNQIWCLKQTAGQDIDVAHYTWTYFESRDRYPYHEVFARNALLLPKHPVPQIWNTGPGSCYGDSPLPKAYAKFGFTYLCLEKGLKSGGIYPGKKWGVVGDGYHNTTRYGEKLDDEERRNSLGVVFRNWHPGPLGFQYISDAFVYRYAEATLDALDMIEEALESDSDPVETFARPIYTASDLPKPQNCIEKFCPMDEPSECLNLEEPTFGFHGASPASASDDLNLYAKAKQNWATFRNDRGPNYMVSKSDIKYMKRDPSLQCTFPDHCAGFQGSWDSGTLAFRLPKMSMGVISVCFCCGKKSGVDFLEHYKDWVDFELDGEHKLDKSKFFAGKGFGEKCVTVMDEWPNGLSNNNGHFYLGVIVRDDLIPEVNRTKFNLRLDHVVTM